MKQMLTTMANASANVALIMPRMPSLRESAAVIVRDKKDGVGGIGDKGHAQRFAHDDGENHRNNNADRA